MRHYIKKELIALPIVGFGAALFFAVLLRVGDSFFREPPVTPRVTVTIPEGSTVSEINAILERSGVLVDAELPQSLEGYLFPDTYEFFLDSSVQVVEEKFRENFEAKAAPLIASAGKSALTHEILTVASLIESEVPNSSDRKIVAGIIWKRLQNDIPLQIDASLCYIKEQPCFPITERDKSIDSPYNTYRYRGLPPGPIANPGLDAIEAALYPEQSPYWYYLSNPENRETIFSRTLDEHNQNVIKYLSE